MLTLKDLATKITATPIGKSLHKKIALYKSSNVLPACRPQFLHVETTSICNAKCAMCAHSEMMRPKRAMNEDVFQKIVNEAISNKIEWVNIQFYGEPLMDKRIYQRIRALKDVGIRVKLNTNASLLNEANAKRLIGTGIDQVNISFDAFSRDTYNKIRVGLDYDKVIDNIEGLVRIRNRARAKTRVLMAFVCLEANKDEASFFRKKWKRVADKIIISFARDWAGRKEVKGYKSLLPGEDNICMSLWKDLVILQDGKVALCCSDYEGEGEMGDLNHQSLHEIWNGDKFVYYRKFHRLGRRSELKICKDCDYYSFWWKS